MRQHVNRTIAAVSISAVLFVTACSMDFGLKPIDLREGAGIVKLAHYPPSKDCAELGRIVGLTDRLDRVRFTRLEIVEQDQENALRNAAYALGGDYVYLDPNDPKANSGTAYQCDPNSQALQIAPPSTVPQEKMRAPAAAVQPSAVPGEKTPAPAAAVQASPAKPAPVEQPDSIKYRLRLLQSLYKDGLITAEEYAAKKKDILSEL